MMKRFFEPDIQVSDLSCQRNDTVGFLHEQLASSIRRSGHQGDVMIPNKTLAERLKVAPQTLHKVYLMLAEDGLLFRQEGKRLWQLSVSSSHVRCFGLVLPTSFSVYFPYRSSVGQCHFRMYTGLVERAAELGYTILPVQLPAADSDRETCLQALRRLKQTCAGVIHLGRRVAAHDLPLQVLIDCHSLPQVSLDCSFLDSQVSSVTFDAQQTIHLFVESMRELGHQHLAFIRQVTSPVEFPPVSYTLTQVPEISRLFLHEGVCDEDLTLVDFNRKTWNDYRQTIASLLRQDEPPTAFLCRNDDIAIELMRIIREEGYRVPEDFSVMGFNDLSEAESSMPPLTTISNPLVKLGAALADQLHRRIHAEEQGPMAPVRIPPVLIPRGSTGPCLRNVENH